MVKLCNVKMHNDQLCGEKIVRQEKCIFHLDDKNQKEITQFMRKFKSPQICHIMEQSLKIILPQIFMEIARKSGIELAEPVEE